RHRGRVGGVVVAAQGQAGDRVGGGVPGGEVDHRDVVVLVPQTAADVEAADVGQQHVQPDQVRPFRTGEGEALPSGTGGADLETVETQGGLNQIPDVGFVVDHEYMGARRGL